MRKITDAEYRRITLDAQNIKQVKKSFTIEQRAEYNEKMDKILRTFDKETEHLTLSLHVELNAEARAYAKSTAPITEDVMLLAKSWDIDLSAPLLTNAQKSKLELLRRCEYIRLEQKPFRAIRLEKRNSLEQKMIEFILNRT